MARINIAGGQVNLPKQEARQAGQGLNIVLDDLTTNWDGLSAAAKQAALRQGIIVALRLLKWLAQREKL